MNDEIIKGITICKEPMRVEPMKVNNNKLKAETISKDTGIHISYIYDDSYGQDFVFDRSSDWIQINNKWFFLKDKHNLSDINDSLEFFNELLGQEISNYFDLETATYMIVKKYKNKHFKYCLLSENCFDNNYDYFAFEDLNIPTENKKLADSLNIIKQLCQNNADNNYLLLQDIIKMSIRDLYSNTIDRHNLNFFFKKSNGILRLAPLFDYEHSFMEPATLYENPLVKIDISDNETCETIKNDDTFQESINKLMNINISKLLNLAQEKNGILLSENFKNIFINHDKKTKTIVKNYFLKK